MSLNIQIRQSAKICLLAFVFACSFSPSLTFAAGMLLQVSDVINDSVPLSTSTTHQITFTTPSAIPVSGKIVITPEAVAGFSFTIPVGFDFNDVTVAVSSGGGPFIARDLASTPSALNDGVSVVTGASGSITITLASGFNISANSVVRIGLGNVHFITSPALATAYRIRLQTRSAFNVLLSNGTAMVAIILPVLVDTGAGNLVPPLRFNGLPTGLIPGSTAVVWASLNTDITADCKFAFTPGTSFFDMATSSLMNKGNYGTLHWVSVVVHPNDIFDYYVRCMNESLIVNTTDFNIHFEVGVVPSATSSTSSPPVPPPPPTPPSSSGPSGGGGGGGLFLQQGAVTLQGSSIPSGSIVITKDGVSVKEEQVSVLGTFEYQFTGLERGTYTWGVRVRDPDGKNSSTYNSTIYLIGGTNNLIAPIYISPTIGTAITTIPVGQSFVVSGYAIPLVPVKVFMNKQGTTEGGQIVTATTTANGNGSWKLTLPTDGLVKGTYEVKAQSLPTTKDQSLFSPVLYVGLGEDPNPDFKNRADLNRDGKVNLVDFSILLFNWKTSDAVADINQDGTVNLTDFSIMLANWTG